MADSRMAEEADRCHVSSGASGVASTLCAVHWICAVVASRQKER